MKNKKGEVGKQYEKERQKELREINLKKQTPTKDQLQMEKIDTYHKRNEIDQQRLDLEYKKYHESK